MSVSHTSSVHDFKMSSKSHSKHNLILNKRDTLNPLSGYDLGSVKSNGQPLNPSVIDSKTPQLVDG